MSFEYIWNKGTRHCLLHLADMSLNARINGVDCSVKIEFGHHCYTDEKGEGQAFKPTRDNRYFSQKRYDASFSLPKLVNDLLVKQDAHLTAFKHRSHQECYYHIDYVDYTLFMVIQKPPGTTNQLKVRITSAYEKDKWGELPSGKVVKMFFLLSEKLKGNSIL